MSDVTGFGLEEEEQVAIFLSFVVVGEETLLGVCSVVQMAGDFVLLYYVRIPSHTGWKKKKKESQGGNTSSNAMRF